MGGKRRGAKSLAVWAFLAPDREDNGRSSCCEDKYAKAVAVRLVSRKA